MQIKLRVLNPELATLFSALFGDGPPETYPSKLSQGCRSMLRELGHELIKGIPSTAAM
jgi:hypothetical protein